MTALALSRLILLITLLGVYHVTAQTDGDIKLDGNGKTTSQGRVRIYYNGIWHTVCISRITSEVGNVMCRQLGFTTQSYKLITNNNLFGPTPASTVPQKAIECKGGEALVRNCAVADSTNTAVCPTDHSKDMLLHCTGTLPGATTTTQKPDFGTLPPVTCGTASDIVKLEGGPNASEGRVMIKYNTQWGAICDDGWGLNDAKVVCSMLCSTASQAVALTGMYEFKPEENAIAKIWLTNLRCTGQEKDLSRCSHDGWGNHNCKLSEVAAVRCSQPVVKPPAYPTVSLQCTGTEMIVTFDLARFPLVKPMHIRLLVADAGCGFTTEWVLPDKKAIKATVPLQACGTKMTSNATHIIYKSTLVQMVPDVGQTVNYNQEYEVPFECVTPKTVTIKPEPIKLVIIKLPVNTATLSLNTSLNFLMNGKPITNGQVQLGSTFTVKINLVTTDKNLKMIVTGCYAQADQTASTYDLIVNKCPRDSSVIISPITDTSSSFDVKSFQFKDHTTAQIYIHCTTHVCPVKSEISECDRSCASRRRKRDVISHSAWPQFEAVEGITMVVPEGDDWIIVDEGIIIRYVRKPIQTTATKTTTTTTPDVETTKIISVISDATTSKSNIVSKDSATASDPGPDHNSNPADMYKDNVIDVQGGEAHSSASSSISSIFSFLTSLVIMAMTFIIR